MVFVYLDFHFMFTVCTYLVMINLWIQTHAMLTWDTSWTVKDANIINAQTRALIWPYTCISPIRNKSTKCINDTYEKSKCVGFRLLRTQYHDDKTEDANIE